jgi:cell cycle checkpoint protein
MDEEDQEELARMRSLPVEDPLPVHLKYYDRPRSMTSMEVSFDIVPVRARLIPDLQSFVPSIPIDASSFALWIHQSLPAFCTDIEQISNALDSLCGSDIMRTDDDVVRCQH